MKPFVAHKELDFFIYLLPAPAGSAPLGVKGPLSFSPRKYFCIFRSDNDEKRMRLRKMQSALFGDTDCGCRRQSDAFTWILFPFFLKALRI